MCSLVSKRYVHEFFPHAFLSLVFLHVFFLHAFFFHGFFSMGFGVRPKDMVVGSASLQRSSLEMACLLGARWVLSLLEGSYSPGQTWYCGSKVR